MSGEQGFVISYTSTRQEVVNWIRSSVEETRLGSDLVKVVFDIPQVKKVPGAVFADSLNMVLKEYSIVFPREILEKIKKDVMESFEFYAPAVQENLRPREVKIDTTPEISIMMIKGAEPLDGSDGRVELKFDHSVKPGRIMADGRIDFRSINRFPQAREGDHVLRLYEETKGMGGTDVYGKVIVPVPGSPHPVVIDHNTLRGSRGENEDSRARFMDWFAIKPGIIITKFLRDEQRPELLESITIQNQIVVKNIDFTTGNISGDGNTLKCAADLLVEGDIKGQFSVQIEGSLEVKGSIEGKNVDVSEEVKASFIRNSIRSGKYVEVGAALSAKIEAAQSVKVTREIADCSISAPDVFLIGNSDGLLCGHVHISACRLNAQNVVIRNNLVIELGAEVFKKIDEAEKQLASIELEMERESVSFKDSVAVFGQKIQKHVAVDEKDLNLLKMLKKIASMLLKGELSTEKVRSSLQTILSGKIYNLKPVIQLLFKLAELQDDITELKKRCQYSIDQKNLVLEELKTLNVKMKARLYPSGQVLVRCGTKEALFESKSSSGFEVLTLDMRYDQVYGLVNTQN